MSDRRQTTHNGQSVSCSYRNGSAILHFNSPWEYPRSDADQQAGTYQAQPQRNFEVEIQGDSFGTRPKKMRISQRLSIRF